MKPLFSFLSYLMLLALLASCSDDELDGSSDGLPEKGLVVRLSTGKLDTKTQLTSTGAYHHVQEVWAVLYKLKASATDPTNNENYDFVTAENLDWNPLDDAAAYDRPIAPNRDDPKYESDEAQYEIDLKEYEAKYAEYLEAIQAAGGAYGNGLLQQKDFELHSDANGTLLDAGTYRVLCIGLDEVSKTLYGLRKDENNLSDIFATGNTLADAVATITNIENAFEGELFAGWAEFQFEPDNLNIVEVEMKRRVAGVLCYVTDIPRVITDSDGNQLVKGIRLVLNRQANNQVHLCRLVQPYAEDKTYTDFGSSTGDNPFANPTTTVLATYDFISHGAVDENDDPNLMDKGDIIVFKLTPEGAVIKENSLLMGAYLLPVQAPTSGATLSVELLGGSSYDKENVTGEVLATFNATRSGAEGGDASYDILPNYIYHIGNKPEPDGTDKDEPVSLLGQKITVTPMEWDKSYKIPVEYPSVSIESTLQLVDENYSPYAKDYKFDCIGIDDDNNEAYRDEYYMGAPYNKRLFLKVTVNVLKTGWKLEIVGNDMTTNGGPEDRMLFISNKNADGSYTYSTSREVDKWEKTDYIPLLLTSYAENDKSKLDRSVILKLTPKDKYGNLQTEKAQTLSVTQYNALIADLDKGYGTRGYSHVDWNDGETVNWGYVYLGSAYPDWIYDNYDHGTCWNYGGTLYVNAKKNTKSGLFHTTKREYFLESAIYKCATKFLIIDNNYSKDMTSDTDKVWYLPARRELSAFLQNYPDEAGDTQYWSSTAYSYQDAYYNYYIEDDKKVFDEVSREDMNKVHWRNKTLHAMRAACMIEGVTD